MAPPAANLLLLSSCTCISFLPTTSTSTSVTAASRRRTGAGVSYSAAPEPEGVGAATPTRGDLFLQRQQALSAAALVLKHNKISVESEPKRKKKKKKKTAEVDPNVAVCYGCGAPLQVVEIDAPGYVEPPTYELKKRHRQLRTVLCGRCRLLSHGRMVTAVGGHGGYPGGKQFISAEELREKLSHLRHEKVLIVKLVDIVDFNGSFLARIRDLAGANPIILVVTKVDLLPRDTDLNCIGDWVVEATVKKKLNVISVHLTSSKSLVGVAGVISEIQREKKGRDVYILVDKVVVSVRTAACEIEATHRKGSANVGKSAFVNALLRTMAEKDPVAAAAQKYKPMQSAVPGTTLGPIQIEAFQGGGKLFDTPGVHLHHRQAAVVHSEDLPCLAPQSRLRGRSFPVDSRAMAGTKATCLNGFSFFWGGLVRIDVLKALPQTRLTFYGPRKLPIYMVPTTKADEFYQEELGTLLTPPTGKEKAEMWIGLQAVRQLQIKSEALNRPVSDIAISGLGWIAVEPYAMQMQTSDSEESAMKNTTEFHFAVHVPKPVEVYIRPPMPVGKAGGEWYEYEDLTEQEEEARPKWNY